MIKKSADKIWSLNMVFSFSSELKFPDTKTGPSELPISSLNFNMSSGTSNGSSSSLLEFLRAMLDIFSSTPDSFILDIFSLRLSVSTLFLMSFVLMPRSFSGILGIPSMRVPRREKNFMTRSPNLLNIFILNSPA